jgi:hypothetical protein
MLFMLVQLYEFRQRAYFLLFYDAVPTVTRSRKLRGLRTARMRVVCEFESLSGHGYFSWLFFLFSLFCEKGKQKDGEAPVIYFKELFWHYRRNLTMMYQLHRRRTVERYEEMTMNGAQTKIWMDVVMVCSELLSPYLPEKTEENHEKTVVNIAGNRAEIRKRYHPPPQNVTVIPPFQCLGVDGRVI